MSWWSYAAGIRGGALPLLMLTVILVCCKSQSPGEAHDGPSGIVGESSPSGGSALTSEQQYPESGYLVDYERLPVPVTVEVSGLQKDGPQVHQVHLSAMSGGVMKRAMTLGGADDEGASPDWVYPGKYRASVQLLHQGFRYCVPAGDLMIPASNDTVHIRLELPGDRAPSVPHGHHCIAGVIQDDLGEPIPGVRVELTMDDEVATHWDVYSRSARAGHLPAFMERWRNEFEQFRTTVSDREGRWQIDTLPGGLLEPCYLNIPRTLPGRKVCDAEYAETIDAKGIPVPKDAEGRQVRALLSGDFVTSTYARQVNVTIRGKPDAKDPRASELTGDKTVPVTIRNVRRLIGTSYEAVRPGSILWTSKDARSMSPGKYKADLSTGPSSRGWVWHDAEFEVHPEPHEQSITVPLATPIDVRVDVDVESGAYGFMPDPKHACYRVIPADRASPVPRIDPTGPHLPVAGNELTFSVCAPGRYAIEFVHGHIVTSRVSLDVPGDGSSYHTRVTIPYLDATRCTIMDVFASNGARAANATVRLVPSSFPRGGDPASFNSPVFHASLNHEGLFCFPLSAETAGFDEAGHTLEILAPGHAVWEAPAQGWVGALSCVTLKEPCRLEVSLATDDIDARVFSVYALLAPRHDVRPTLEILEESFGMAGGSSALSLGGAFAWDNLWSGEYSLWLFAGNDRFEGYQPVAYRRVTVDAGLNSCEVRIPHRHTVSVDTSAIRGCGSLKLWRPGFPCLQGACSRLRNNEMNIERIPGLEHVLMWSPEPWRKPHRRTPEDQPMMRQEPFSDARVMTFPGRGSIDRDVPAAMLVHPGTQETVVFRRQVANALQVHLVNPDSEVARAGFRHGDVVLGFDGHAFNHRVSHAEWAALAGGLDLKAWRKAAMHPDAIHSPAPCLPGHEVRRVQVRRGQDIIEIAVRSSIRFLEPDAVLIPIRLDTGANAGE